VIKLKIIRKDLVTKLQTITALVSENIKSILSCSTLRYDFLEKVTPLPLVAAQLPCYPISAHRSITSLQ